MNKAAPLVQHHILHIGHFPIREGKDSGIGIEILQGRLEGPGYGGMCAVAGADGKQTIFIVDIRKPAVIAKGSAIGRETLCSHAFIYIRSAGIIFREGIEHIGLHRHAIALIRLDPQGDDHSFGIVRGYAPDVHPFFMRVRAADEGGLEDIEGSLLAVDSSRKGSVGGGSGAVALFTGRKAKGPEQEHSRNFFHSFSLMVI